MIGYIGKRLWQRKLPVLYEDSGAMLIAIIILMREGRSWIRRYWTGLSLLYRRKDRCLFQHCDMSAFWQLRTWQRQVI